MKPVTQQNSPQPDHETYQKSVDLLVVGSGNGALTTALCAKLMADKMGQPISVLVIEKGPQFGGTSAMSGGGIWIPCSRYAKALGVDDSIAEAKQYLQATIPEPLFREEMIDAYLQNGPNMLDFLHENSRVCYQSLEHYPDYYSDLPGARNGHRSLEPEPILGSVLGDAFKLIHESALIVYNRFMLTQVEGQMITGGLRGRYRALAKLILKYYTDFPWRFKHKITRRLTCGMAGISRLYLSLKDNDVELWLNSPMQSLINDNESGKVLGAIVQHEGSTIRIEARRAVMLAAGGFEQNQAMREQYLPAPTNKAWSAGINSNTGDAIVAGQAIGAQTAQMDGAWWCSTVTVPGRQYPFLSIVTKSMPGTFVVNQSGKRYGNESQNYMSWSLELFNVHSETNNCVPSYMIFDSKFKNKYSAFPLTGPDWLLPKSYFTSGLIAKANTIEELANKTGTDAKALAATVKQFNQYAITGKDLDFQRGDAAYDRYYGDPEVKPNPCLAPLTKPPYYAMRSDAGDFGTHGGLLTNPHAQVLAKDGQPIAGLYATGNCSAAVLPTYPGPGSTLGPAMAFGYQAAKHITGFKED